jgi:hypothetical protein
VDEAGILTDVLVDVGQEGDDVMFDFFFDLFDSFDIKCSFGFDVFQSFFGDDSQLDLRFTDGDFNFEPSLKSGLVRPERAHFFASVTVDQCKNLGSRLCRPMWERTLFYDVARIAALGGIFR